MTTSSTPPAATPLIPAPEWLTKRQGSLQPGIREFILFVMLADKPQYRLEARPANGRYACAVTQSINGKRLDQPGLTYPDLRSALEGGLDQLRASLGW